MSIGGGGGGILCQVGEEFLLLLGLTVPIPFYL